MRPAGLRFRGRLADLDAEARRALRDRAVADASSVRDAVAGIVDDVRVRGDAALRELTLRFDRVDLASLEVPRSAWVAALDRLDPAVRRSLERAAANIEKSHRAWVPTGAVVETEPGVTLERRPYPLARVGVYVPGGRAVYPSSVLMGVVPAKVAGVGEIIVTSPAGPSGAPADAILAACLLAGADRVFALGGAQAVAALAYGTASVPRVDRIVGPGNSYVMEAKLQVSSRVGIDSPAGPSEVLVVTDAAADPELIAAELVAQAEHDPDAVAIAVVIGTADAALRIENALARAAASAPRAEIVNAALAGYGGVLTVDTLEQAAGFANDFAAEHLLLAFDGAEQAHDRFRVAGAVFVGAASSVAFGDYLTGGNHVLPTAGLARSYSGLGPSDFMRWTSYQTVSTAAAARLAADTVTLATAEGLPGHARAAALRGAQEI
ncbi:MAG: histidinol dehydrogenase [Gemmatimonadales bacterium]